MRRVAGREENPVLRKATYAILLLVIAGAAFVAGSWIAGRSGSRGSSGSRKVLYYVDPMHPAYRSDKPGIAPDCGMQLEPVYADGTTGGGGSSPGTPGTVTLPQEKRQAVGVAVGKAEKAPWTGTLRLLGRVAADETRTYRVTSATDMWVRKVFPPTTGSLVRKGEPLAAYYTGSFLSAANAYLFALDSRDRHRQNPDISPAQAKNIDSQMRQTRGNLISMGVSELQIEEMEKSRKIGELVEIRSPSDGFVLARAVTEGQFVPGGSELYRIADLGKVWILAETYGSEGKLLRPGMEVKGTHPQTKRTYRAKVTEILPQFDPQTRTMKVRLEADNPGFLLRPDMFVDVEVPVRMPAAVNVPAEAVIDAGTRKTVFVDRGEGRFEPRPVETGWQMGGRVEITKGLMAGESIVVSGNFLVDSESRMKLAAAGIYGASHVDPVCGMHVDEGKAKAAGKTVDHGGKTYYFCSDECVGKFRKEPAKYLKQASTPAKKEMPKQAPMAHGGHEKGTASAAAGAPKEDASAESDDLPIDPVCGMVVDPMTARAANRVSEHKGKTYYFCADMCKKRFDANPGAFLAKPGQGGMGAGQGDPGEHGKDAHGGHGK
jgi:RND family efflux transporter MFP subunit